MSATAGFFIFLFSVFIIAALTFVYKINAAFVMLGVTFLFGLLSGIPLNEILSTIRSGFGATAGYIGIVIFEGIVLSFILEKTGALSVIAAAILKKTRSMRVAAAAGVAGYTLSIPVSCDSGFIALHRFTAILAASAGKSIVSVSMVLVSGLYLSHSLIPPTPGPLSAAGILNASGWKIFFLGMAVSIPGFIAGYLWSVKLADKLNSKPVCNYTEKDSLNLINEAPSLFESVIPVMITIILMVLRSFAVVPLRPFGNGSFAKFVIFAGDPVFAFFIGIICSFILVKKGFYREAAGSWITEGLRRAAPVLVLAAAGGAFGAVIKTSSLTNALITSLLTWKIGLFLPFLTASLLKTATGSSTISIITTASVISPLIASLGVNPVLAVLAIGSGSMVVSHVNDPFFWIVSELTGMGETTALKIFTPLTAITGVTSFIFVLLLSVFI